MSLLTSVTQDSRGVPSFIEAAYTSGGAAMIATASAEGIARIQSSTGNVTRIRGAAPATTLSLGLDGATVGANANAIVVTSGPDLTTIATNASCSQALTVAGSATFNGAVIMSNTAPSLRTFTQAGGAYPSGGAGVALPQPGSLPAGLYSIVLQINDPDDNDYAVSALAYWNGSTWTGGGSASTIKLGGSTVAVINPANPATSLLYYHQKGSDLTVNFVYWTQLSAAFS